MDSNCLTHSLFRSRSLQGLVFGFLLLTLQGGSSAQEYFERYDLSHKNGVVNLAVQPMAYPLAFISAAMQRDRILRAQLKEQSLKLQVFNFRKGNDIVRASAADSFGMAFLGDMPTVNLSAKFPISIAGLGKRNFSSVVSRDFGRLDELRESEMDGVGSHAE